MERTTPLRSRQEELLERLHLYRESKKHKSSESDIGKNRCHSKTNMNRELSSNKFYASKTGPGQTHTKQTKIGQNINQVRSSDVIKLPTSTHKQMTTKTRLDGAKEVARFSFSKAHAISRTVKENVVPNRKRRRSFTLDSSEVSPFLKRPVITSSSTVETSNIKNVRINSKSVDTSLQRKHSLGTSDSHLIQSQHNVPKPAHPKTSIKSDTSRVSGATGTGSTTRCTQAAASATNRYLPYLNPKLSRRERLELWKKEKEQQRLRMQKRKPENDKKMSSPLNKCATSGRSISTSQFTPSTGHPRQSCNQPRPLRLSKKLDVQHTSLSSGVDAAKNLAFASSFERRKSYASQLRNQSGQKGKSTSKTCTKNITKVVCPSKHHHHSSQEEQGKQDDNPLKRRLSYAMSLRQRIESTTSSSQKTCKRRTTVSGVSMRNVQNFTRVESENKHLMSCEETLPCSAQLDAQSSSKNKILKSSFSRGKTNLGNSQATDSVENTVHNDVRRSCRKSLSVKFANECSPDVKRTRACKKTPTPIHAMKTDGTPVMTPSRLTAIKKEPSLREKLDSWLASHGKTPSRFTHLLKFGKDLSIASPNPQVMAGLDVDELLKQQEQLAVEEKQMNVSSVESDRLLQKVEAILSECIVLLDSDCPTYMIEEWLRKMCDNLDGVKQVARYWVCLAKMAQKSQDQNAVVQIFEESLKHNVQPPEELADALRDFMQGLDKAAELNSSLADYLPQTPETRVRNKDVNDVFISSAVKFLYKTTPFSKIQMKCRRSYSTPHAVITPVRRSTRCSVASLPRMFKDHDRIIESLGQLSLEEKKQIIFMPNTALDNSLNTSGTAI